MATKRFPLLVLAIFAGLALILFGVVTIHFYFTMGASDKSYFFWLISVLFIGIFAFIAGLSFITGGILAFRGSKLAYTATKYSLILLGLILAIFAVFKVVGTIRYSFKHKAGTQQQRLSQYLNRYTHKLKSLSIVSHDSKGFDVEVAITKGIPGKYILEMRITNQGTIFLKNTETITLGTDALRLTKRVEYANLFRICSEPSANRRLYVCVNNAGTAGIRFVITARLTLREDSAARIKKLTEKFWVKRSLAKTVFCLDTRSKAGRVIVKRIQQVNPD